MNSRCAVGDPAWSDPAVGYVKAEDLVNADVTAIIHRLVGKYRYVKRLAAAVETTGVPCGRDAIVQVRRRLAATPRFRVCAALVLLFVREFPGVSIPQRRN